MPHTNDPPSYPLLRRHMSLAMWSVVGVVSAPTMADSLVVRGRDYHAVRITGLADGYLVFRTAAGASQSARIDTVGLI